MSATVPHLAPGGTVLCIASGPSLTREDVEYCRDKVDASIVVNTSFRMAPWATALSASDRRWWAWHYKEVKHTFPGLKFATSTVMGNVRTTPSTENCA